MSMPPTDAIARDALEKIADNIAYMRGELPGLAPPEDIRAAILSTCARFDQTVRRPTPDEPAGALSPLSDALKDMPEGAVLYVYGQDADGLLEAMTDRPAGSAPDSSHREGDFGQARPAAKRGEPE